MTALWFFLAGLPVAFLLDRAIVLLAVPDDDEPEDAPLPAPEDAPAAQHPGPQVRVLPWQVGPWPGRVRHGVAALAPVLMAVAGWRFDAPQAVAVSALVFALLLCTGTDLIEFRVPNVVTYPGTLLALLAALVLPGGDVLSGLVAAGVAGAAFLVLAVLTRGGLGLGDVKLAVLIGAGLGLQSAYQALVLGILAGGVIIVGLFALRVVSRRQAVPYAPFLALAAVAVVLAHGGTFAHL